MCCFSPEADDRIRPIADLADAERMTIKLMLGDLGYLRVNVLSGRAGQHAISGSVCRKAETR